MCNLDILLEIIKRNNNDEIMLEADNCNIFFRIHFTLLPHTSTPNKHFSNER